MSIKINGRQLEITSTIRDWVGDRLKALSEDSVLKTTQVNATLEREKSTFRASLVLNCKYHTLTAEVTGPDLGRVFESGARKLEAQARSLRDKIRSHKADGVSETEQNQQPRQTFSHALLQRLLQIFLCGQTCETCIVFAHFVIDNFDDAL